MCICSMMMVSCEQDEPLWELPPKKSEAEKTASVVMGNNYDHVIYFKLSDGSSVTRKLVDWDLAFATGADENHLVMNGGKELQVYVTGDTDFVRTTYTASDASAWTWDNPNGNLDSTAFGTLTDAGNVSLKTVYILDMGMNAIPRYKKLQVVSVSATNYRIQYANLDNSDHVLMDVAKDAAHNFSYVHLGKAAVVDFEPVSNEWDMVFTKYRHVYYDMSPVTPYLVTGALLNTKKARICETSLKYESITDATIPTLSFSTKADEIGFDWKFYDLNGSGKYIVNPNKIYIIKDREGVYYKLRFDSFYGEGGAKGTPGFTYQKL